MYVSGKCERETKEGSFALLDSVNCMPIQIFSPNVAYVEFDRSTNSIAAFCMQGPNFSTRINFKTNVL
jgi:hypothetical protein